MNENLLTDSVTIVIIFSYFVSLSMICHYFVQENKINNNNCSLNLFNYISILDNIRDLWKLSSSHELKAQYIASMSDNFMNLFHEEFYEKN